MANPKSNLGVYLLYALRRQGVEVSSLEGATAPAWYKRIRSPESRLRIEDAQYLAEKGGMSQREAGEVFFPRLPKE